MASERMTDILEMIQSDFRSKSYWKPVQEIPLQFDRSAFLQGKVKENWQLKMYYVDGYFPTKGVSRGVYTWATRLLSFPPKTSLFVVHIKVRI